MNFKMCTDYLGGRVVLKIAIPLNLKKINEKLKSDAIFKERLRAPLTFLFCEDSFVFRGHFLKIEGKCFKMLIRHWKYFLKSRRETVKCI